MGSAQPLPEARDWRWHTVPAPPEQAQVPCPICWKVDVAGQGIIVWRELFAGCWPCVFGLAADTGKARREKAEPQVAAVSTLLWTPGAERQRKS